MLGGVVMIIGSSSSSARIPYRSCFCAWLSGSLAHGWWRCDLPASLALSNFPDFCTLGAWDWIFVATMPRNPLGAACRNPGHVLVRPRAPYLFLPLHSPLRSCERHAAKRYMTVTSPSNLRFSSHPFNLDCGEDGWGCVVA